MSGIKETLKKDPWLNGSFPVLRAYLLKALSQPNPIQGGMELFSVGLIESARKPNVSLKISNVDLGHNNED